MKYTLDDIRDLYDQFKQDYTRLREKQRLWQSLIDCTYDNGLDVNTYDHPIKPDTAMRIVNIPVDFLALDKIIIKQEPKIVGTKQQNEEQSKADKIEIALQALLNKWIDIPPYFRRLTLLDLTKRGSAYYRITVNPKLAERDKNFSGLPFFIDAIDPLFIYSSPEVNEYGSPDIVFYIRKMPVYSIKRLMAGNNTREYPSLENFKLKDELCYVEWWTPETRGYIAGPEVELASVPGNHWQTIPFMDEEEFPNPYGFVPYVVGFSLRDRPSMDGDPYSSSRSLLDGLEDLIIQESRNQTRFDTMAAYAAFVEEDVTLSSSTVTVNQLRRKPGIPRISTPDEKWTIRPPIGIPPAIIQQNAEITRRLSDRMPSVAKGEALPGEPAIASSNRFNWATQGWEHLKIAANHMLVNALTLVLQTVEKMDLSVELGGATLDKELIDGHYALKIKTMIGNPEQERWLKEQGKGLWGFMPPARIVEDYFQVENATEYLKELYAWTLIDTIFKNPNNPLVQPIMGLLAEALRLKLEEKGLITPNLSSPQPSLGPQVAIHGSPTKGISPLPNTGPGEADQLAMLQQLMNRRLE